MSILLMVSDIGSLMIAGVISVVLRALIGEGLREYQEYLALAPIVLIFIAVYYISSLYPAIGMDVVSELQKLTIATSIVLPLLATITFWAQTSISYSRLIFSFFWIFALFLVPVGRRVTRHLFHSLNLWGEPIALIGFGPQGKEIYRYLKNNPTLGFLPVIIFDGEHAQKTAHDIPVLPLERLIQDEKILSNIYIYTAILVTSDIASHFRASFINERIFGIRHLIQTSSFQWVGGSAVVPHDFQGLLGLEVECNLLNPLQQTLKRAIEILFIFIASPLLVPLFACIALSIRLDSKGGVFYGHRRIGQGGKEFTLWKFRTMVHNADEVLQHCLQQNPELSAEWNESHKLKNDPRVTGVGRFIRKSSLDELPQIWNIIKGEMSLVGPRPIIQAETLKYEENISLYIQVKPGLTGLWQVSGRSNLSYAHRVRLDEYYIRRWSIWMDIYILLRTIPVVIQRAGAY
ncbi:MAG: undecaprenyl-phosphate galactose phosphotransferase WbaP [Anaerolineaceae bacterium]|nr:undecaprenyl-phosphate galactose phosphotransferase WbaP [Anaerolineaceae bacterium]